jgi:hypothetical protein
LQGEVEMSNRSSDINKQWIQYLYRLL